MSHARHSRNIARNSNHDTSASHSSLMSPRDLEEWKRQTTSDFNYYVPDECPRNIDDCTLIDTHPVRITVNMRGQFVDNPNVVVQRLPYGSTAYQDSNGRYINASSTMSLHHTNGGSYSDRSDFQEFQDPHFRPKAAAWTSTVRQERPLFQHHSHLYRDDELSDAKQRLTNHDSPQQQYSTSNEKHAPRHYIPAFIVSNDFEPDEGFSTFLQPKNDHTTTHQQKKKQLAQIVPQMSNAQLDETVSILEASPLHPHNNSNINILSQEQQRRLVQPQSILASTFDDGTTKPKTSVSSSGSSSKASPTLFGTFGASRSAPSQYNAPAPSGKHGIAWDHDEQKDGGENVQQHGGDSLTDKAKKWVLDTHQTWLNNWDKADGPRYYPTVNMAPFTKQGTHGSTDIVSVHVSPSHPRYDEMVRDLSSKQTPNPRVGIDKPPHSAKKTSHNEVSLRDHDDDSSKHFLQPSSSSSLQDNAPNCYVTGPSYDVLPAKHVHDHFDKEAHLMEKDTKLEDPSAVRPGFFAPYDSATHNTSRTGSKPQGPRPTIRYQLSQAELNNPRKYPAPDKNLVPILQEEDKMQAKIESYKEPTMLDQAFHQGAHLLNKTSEAIFSWNATPKQWWSKILGTSNHSTTQTNDLPQNQPDEQDTIFHKQI